jgi:hypothetical protein
MEGWMDGWREGGREGGRKGGAIKREQGLGTWWRNGRGTLAMEGAVAGRPKCLRPKVPSSPPSLPPSLPPYLGAEVADADVPRKAFLTHSLFTWR